MVWEDGFCFKVEIHHDVMYKEEKKWSTCFYLNTFNFQNRKFFSVKNTNQKVFSKRKAVRNTSFGKEHNLCTSKL